jgi:RNA polymerase sigma-70 factor (ECF subfamily)
MFIDLSKSFAEETRNNPVEFKKLPADILQAAMALQQGRAGEEEWRIIWEYYRPKLDAVAHKFHLQCCDREDVVQKIFIRVFKHGEKLENPEKFEFWLRRIAYNEMKRFVSQPKRIICNERLLAQKQEEGATGMLSPSAAPTPGQELESQVKACVDKMPARMRQAYLLCRVQRFRQKEVAQFMQISVKGVQRHLELAKNFLRQNLAARQKKV